MPRHPPCALTHLTTTRCSHPLCNTQHTTTPRTHHRHHTKTSKRISALGRPGREWSTSRSTTQVSPQDPTVCELESSVRTKQQNLCSTQPHPHRNRQPPARCLIRCGISERRDTHLQSACTNLTIVVRLLRKEVIQPHLPVRLPCYDFVPIASPTFDDSPHKWLGHRLRVLPTFVT